MFAKHASDGDGQHCRTSRLVLLVYFYEKKQSQRRTSNDLRNLKFKKWEPLLLPDLHLNQTPIYYIRRNNASSQQEAARTWRVGSH